MLTLLVYIIDKYFPEGSYKEYNYLTYFFDTILLWLIYALVIINYK